LEVSDEVLDVASFYWEHFRTNMLNLLSNKEINVMKAAPAKDNRIDSTTAKSSDAGVCEVSRYAQLMLQLCNSNFISANISRVSDFRVRASSSKSGSTPSDLVHLVVIQNSGLFGISVHSHNFANQFIVHKVDVSMESVEMKVKICQLLTIFGATLDLFIANRNAGEFEIDINTLPQMPSKLPHGLKPFSFATAVVAAVSPATMSIEPTGTSTSGFTANLDMTASDDTITAPGAAGQDDMERPQLKKSRLNETAAEASVNV